MWILLLLKLIGFSFCEVLDYYNFIEGDTLETESAREVPYFIWPNAEVPYEISYIYTNAEKQNIREAMDEMEQKTCVRFREATKSDHDIIGIVKEGVCASFVGRQGNIQDLSLGEGCFDRKKILHQLMHALGFVHEHNRADRDEYITINWENIQGDKIYNFKKRMYEDMTLMDTLYSYNSIMHYPSGAYAKYGGNQTVVAKKPTNNMGGGEQLSDIDVERIRKLYCPERPPPPLPTTIEGFKFQKGNGEIMWSNGCNFYGNDIDQKQIKDEDCGDYCVRNPKCSHFSWNRYNGGVCYLKGGFAFSARPQNVEWSSICGYRGTSISEGSQELGRKQIWWYNFPNLRWLNATVPYRLSQGYTDSEKQKIREAMDEMEQKTCVRFRETTESDHDIINIDLLMSTVRDRDEKKKMVLDRPDRDEYVDIIWDNIVPTHLGNFKKRESEHLTLMDTPYSYDSIMHFTSDAFAKVKGQPTIIAKKPTNNIGGGDHLSDIDVMRIRTLYCP